MRFINNPSGNWLFNGNIGVLEECFRKENIPYTIVDLIGASIIFMVFDDGIYFISGPIPLVYKVTWDAISDIEMMSLSTLCQLKEENQIDLELIYARAEAAIKSIDFLEKFANK